MGHIECWFDDGEYSNGTGTTYNIKYILPKYWKHNVSKTNSKSQSVGSWLYSDFLKNYYALRALQKCPVQFVLIPRIVAIRSIYPYRSYDWFYANKYSHVWTRCLMEDNVWCYEI